MLIKIAIIVLLVVLLFGCADSGSAYTSKYEQSQDKVIISTMPGTENIYKSKYISAGMTYEVVYIKSTVYGSGGNGISLQMNVINLTEDSLKVEQMRQYLEPEKIK